LTSHEVMASQHDGLMISAMTVRQLS